MADHPSDEWSGEGDPRHLVRRNAEGRSAAKSRGGHTTTTGLDRYKRPSKTKIVTGTEERDKQAKKDAKAVSSKAVENKSVKSSAKK